MPASGDSSGLVLPATLPLLTNTANIQDALRNFYYGSVDDASAATEGAIPLESVLGRIIEARNSRLPIASPTATTQLSISHATTPKLILTRGANTGTLQHTVASNVTLEISSIAQVTETTLSNLSSIGSSATTITMGGAGTVTYSIGTAVKITSTKTINIGQANDTVAKTINIGGGSATSTTTVNIGTNSGGTSAINTYGTLVHTGAATISSTLGVTGALTGGSFVVGSSGPTITSGSAAPTSTPVVGSLYLRTGQAYTDSMYVYGAGSPNSWRKMRGNMWFTGTGVDPNSLSLGEQSGDLYYNRLTGEIWQAT